ncbi:MAG: NAD(P)/FAD-dependent oxidoreductase [Candidatus Bathyarchaeia archaeon]
MRVCHLGFLIPLGDLGPSTRYDCVVVGAGPSGSSAAFTLARNGFRVLMLDRCRFPRVKPCGDALAAASVLALERIFRRPVLDRIEEKHRINRARLRGPGGAEVEVKVRPGFVVRRALFDMLLVQLAIEAGATFLQDRVFEPLMEKSSVVGVRGADAQYRAPVVIGADGFPSSLARRLGMGPIMGFERDNLGVAVRTYCRSSEPLGDCLELLYSESIAPGYGWVFPLDDWTANFGVGALVPDLRRRKTTLLECLRRMASDIRCRRLQGLMGAERPEGGGIPLGPTLASTFDDGVLFVGDAAGFVNPITGEGVHYALTSGHLAALTAAEALDEEDYSAEFLRRYERRWKKQFGLDFFICRALRQIIFSRPRDLDRVIAYVNTSRYWQTFLSRMIDHTIDYSSLRLTEMLTRVPRAVLRSASTLRPP